MLSLFRNPLQPGIWEPHNSVKTFCFPNTFLVWFVQFSSLQAFVAMFLSNNLQIYFNLLQVYSHSYLGLGLQAARQAVLELENSDVMSSGGEVTSSCMTSRKGPKSWSFQGKEFKISTRRDGSSSHAQCTDTVQQILQVTVVHSSKSQKICGVHKAQQGASRGQTVQIVINDTLPPRNNKNHPLKSQAIPFF